MPAEPCGEVSVDAGGRVGRGGLLTFLVERYEWRVERAEATAYGLITLVTRRTTREPKTG